MNNEQAKTRAWKEFSVNPPAGRLENYASINRHGKIVLNHKLYVSLGSPKCVVVLYDEQTETIGLRPASSIMPNAITVYTAAASHRVWIRAHAFIKAAKLKFDYCIRFTKPPIEDGVLILDLSHTTRVLGPRLKAVT